MATKKAASQKKHRTVSSKVPRLKSKIPNTSDPLSKLIMGHFDDELKNEFASFLQERAKAKVIPIKKGKKSERGEYNKEGKEPLSFKEVTSFKNPLFSSPGKYNPAEVNPETIDVDTFTLMRRNYQLSIGLSIIKMPIVALPWRIKCDDLKVEKTVEWMLQKVWKKLIKTLLMAVDYGFASHEKVWERENVKISDIDKEGKEEVYYQGDIVYFKKIKPHHPESIKMKFDELQNLIEIVQEGSLGSSKDIELPIRKCFLFTNDEEYGNPFGVSRLKNAYSVWYYQSLLLQFMMQYYERKGTPPTIATAPQGRGLDSSGTEVDNLELALRVATSLISSSVAVLPYQANKEGRENMWKLENLTDDGRGTMFIEALVHLESRCLRALFIPEGIISSDESGGSGSNSVSADIFLMTQKGLITDIEDAVNKQIIKPFIEANFPPEEQRPAGLKLDPLSFERKITIKEIFAEMLRNIDTAIQMGVAPTLIPSMEQMAKIIEVPLESWKDATGMTPEEFKDMVAQSKQPQETSPESSETNGKGSSGSKATKLLPRKKTRKKSVDQTQDRRRSNPTSRRSDRKRNPLNKDKSD